MLIVLFVKDLAASRAFYGVLLEQVPLVDEPGMVIFPAALGVELGLMPESGIRRLVPGLPEAALPGAAPRCEVYLRFADPDAAWERACAAGGRPLSPLQLRDWQERAGYLLDPDGHLVACAGMPGGHVTPLP